MSTQFNKFNFHTHTFCIFTEVDLPSADVAKPDHVSNSGSRYYFSDDGVLRISNHWGRAGNCKWRVLPKCNTSKQRTKAGFARWSEFYPDNNHEKLYYLDIDTVNRVASYNHKDHPTFDGNKILLTASETIKQIRKIRMEFKANLDRTNYVTS